ncbi:zinc knuckle-domain-containing protein [Ganoderma leucocontextum]|nr:zinc knuckle-domain-containing protein [Ganoderma leucocontextum]
MSKYAPHRSSSTNPRASATTICQKCLKPGHFIYDCKGSRPYISRPSRTQQLENPKVLAKLKADGKPSVEVPEEFKSKTGTANRILEEKEKERLKNQDKGEGSSRKRRRYVPPWGSILTTCMLTCHLQLRIFVRLVRLGRRQRFRLWKLI